MVERVFFAVVVMAFAACSVAAIAERAKVRNRGFEMAPFWFDCIAFIGSVAVLAWCSMVLRPWLGDVLLLAATLIASEEWFTAHWVLNESEGQRAGMPPNPIPPPPERPRFKPLPQIVKAPTASTKSSAGRRPHRKP